LAIYFYVLQGLGPSTLSVLNEQGLVKTALDIFHLRRRTARPAAALTNSDHQQQQQQSSDDTSAGKGSRKKKSAPKQLCETTLADLPGWGDTKALNLLEAIDAARTVTLTRFIFALGIR
jgi:NAD-dependent DNA ligase